MAGPVILALAELTDGQPTRLSLELATLASDLAVAAGGTAVAAGIGPRAGNAAPTLARHVERVISVEAATEADAPAAIVIASLLAALLEQQTADIVLLPASPDGKDVAGMLAARLDLPILVNAASVAWADGRPVVEMSAFGGRLVTRSTFTGATGIVVVRPGATAARERGSEGSVEVVDLEAAPDPRVTAVERVVSAGAAVSIDDAPVVVAGGRGVAGPEGFAVIEDLADAFGGAVAGTRAVVDAGWLPYAQQVGQTGKIIKPALYVAVGISGAIQHKVGMQTSGTIVAINRDADAPIADFADLLIVGDLFEVAPRLAAAVRARRG
ncbi:MAG: electron transfer flavoprotein subunit alpha/FixB family protein [Candidatus Limnocylindrales bacterium]|jgi:electron transfer flavoprotein alpha subunit